ncbi:hypothetical protein [Pseudomonas viridiflava]|uniref:hypothetical protein n=1 Tax=Pseudomonas viridiflava TaxID=33069 RepID=UPI002EB66730|nr:hypothetical protein [Pseudomonas viridiflava]
MRSKYHRHLDFEAKTIFHVDPATGEVINHNEMTLPKNPEGELQAWAAERRADPSLSKDTHTALANLPALTTNTQGNPSDSRKATRGRPRTAYPNPAAAYMYLFAIPDPLPWVDDIVTGSIITSAGVTNGKTNVKRRAVINALFLSEITAEACKTDEMTLRTAQRIAKAARHAAHGIASYVERHPRIKAEIDVEALFRAS